MRIFIDLLNICLFTVFFSLDLFFEAASRKFYSLINCCNLIHSQINYNGMIFKIALKIFDMIMF